MTSQAGGYFHTDEGAPKWPTPDIIHNPVSGERIEFISTAADTNGELLEIDLTLSPDGSVPGAHVHPEQEERFDVLEGTMKFRLGMKTIVAEAGDMVVVPEGPRAPLQERGRRPGAGARARSCLRSTWSSCSRRPSSSPTRAA